VSGLDQRFEPETAIAFEDDDAPIAGELQEFERYRD